MKPWLWLPPRVAHALSPWGVQLYSALSSAHSDSSWNSFSWCGLTFQNRLGIAGGVDKGADLLHCWENIGCGFAEVGTVTVHPQKPNPGKILDRSLVDQALWNKMGFPSDGVEDFYFNLRDFKNSQNLNQPQKTPFPIFANIGKNRSTTNAEAFLDYIQLMQKLESMCDSFVLNISSPNTKGLRELATPKYLKEFLNPIVQARAKLTHPRPLLLKLSPDLAESEILQILETACEEGIDGFVLTNTTLSRETHKKFPDEGGVSGLPLQKLSLQALKLASKYLKSVNTHSHNNKLLISVGGVMTAQDVFERIELGADLVQVYSALIFSGPGFFKSTAKEAHGK